MMPPTLRVSNTGLTQLVHSSPQVQAIDTELWNNLGLRDGTIDVHLADLGG